MIRDRKFLHLVKLKNNLIEFDSKISRIQIIIGKSHVRII